MAGITDIDTNLTALEATTAAVVTEVNTLKASEDEAALEAFAGRIATVNTTLSGLTTPPPLVTA